MHSPPLSPLGWISLNAICNLPKDPGGTHRLLLRSINSSSNQLSEPAWRPVSLGSPPDCHGGAGGLIFQLESGNPRAAVPHPAPCVPRSPPPPRGFRLHHPPRPPFSTGFQGEGRRQRASWAGTIGRPEASSLPRVGSSPQPPSR